MRRVSRWGVSLMGAQQIRKAVIPAAGLGTRFLPATKVVPKEMLPVCGKPAIQFAVEEAVNSGLDTVILVLSPGKELIAEHFRSKISLEKVLAERGQDDELRAVRRISELADVHIVWQKAPLGLADAIRCTRSVVDDEPFAVILPDALIDPSRPCIRQLISCYDRFSGCVLATREVNSSEVERFGILEVDQGVEFASAGGVFRVRSLVEKPNVEQTSSRYGIFGRYILEPDIFGCIDSTTPDPSGELQITDSLQLFLQHAPLYAYRFEGVHYDIGDLFGFMQANIEYALSDPMLGRKLREFLEGLDSERVSAVL